MSPSIKVKRSGIEKIFGKVKPFRHWLNEQPRNKLTYLEKAKTSDLVDRGWTVQDFLRECWERKMDVRIGTVLKWQEGTQPRPGLLHELTKQFPTITF
jgi:hypothetical protein